MHSRGTHQKLLFAHACLIFVLYICFDFIFESKAGGVSASEAELVCYVLWIAPSCSSRSGFLVGCFSNIFHVFDLLLENCKTPVARDLESHCQGCVDIVIFECAAPSCSSSVQGCRHLWRHVQRGSVQACTHLCGHVQGVSGAHGHSFRQVCRPLWRHVQGLNVCRMPLQLGTCSLCMVSQEQFQTARHVHIFFRLTVQKVFGTCLHVAIVDSHLEFQWKRDTLTSSPIRCFRFRFCSPIWRSSWIIIKLPVQWVCRAQLKYVN